MARALAGGLLLVTAIALWNAGVTRWRLAHASIPGAFYPVDGRRMYIYCRGAGSPALVIESGFNGDSLGWYGVQRDLAGTTRVCAYDRSGLGLSEPRTGARDAETIARELHELLTRAGVSEPVVLVGWSAGGYYAREYAREFPAQVAALALVDASVPELFDESQEERASLEADKRERPIAARWERLRVLSGWERLMGRCDNSPSDELKRLPSAEYAALAALYVAKTCRPAFVGGEIGELLDLETTAQQAGRLTEIAKPVLIISEDTDQDDLWNREQERLKSLSSLSWRVIARNSQHAIHHTRPDVVVSEIARLVVYLRGGPTPPFGETAVAP